MRIKPWSAKTDAIGSQGLGEGGVGCVGGFDGIEDRTGAEELGGLIEQRAEAGAERDGADGTVVRFVREAKGLQFVTRGKNDVVGFIEVMVFRIPAGDKMATLGLSALRMAVAALKRVKTRSAEEGARWPVTMAGSPCRRRAMFSRVAGAGVEAGRFWAFEQIGDAGADGRVLCGSRSIGDRRGWTG